MEQAYAVYLIGSEVKSVILGRENAYQAEEILKRSLGLNFMIEPVSEEEYHKLKEKQIKRESSRSMETKLIVEAIRKNGENLN